MNPNDGDLFMKNPPDILNSKIKKLRIELPHYSFSHSAAGDSPHAFIGRERSREKLKKVIEDSPDEPGVYLVAGNRGVGKTSLISWVINETSLKPKSKFTENLRYLVFLFLAVAGFHVLKQLCLDVFSQFRKEIQVIWSILLGLSFITLCFLNSYRHKIAKHKIGINIFDSVTSAFKELSYLISPYNPYGKTQYLFKIIVIVSFTQLVFIISCIFTPTIVLLGYLVIVLVKNIIFRLKRENHHKDDTSFLLRLKKLFLFPIKNYIKNHNRLYLRINFGHKLSDEKDILRLITHTLITEYEKYRHLIWRMLPWRIIAFIFLLFFTFSFSKTINDQIFYKKLIKDNELYQASSQMLLEHPDLKDEERLKDAFSIIKTNKVTEIVKIHEDIEYEIISTRTKSKPKIDTKIGKAGNILLTFDQIVYEITKIIKKAPQFFLCKNIDNGPIKPINYLFWLTFFFTYLLFTMIFRCKWITPFFVTHRIIMRRLKKLNSDIIYRTELENSININNGSSGSGIGIKTKKKRNVADAREIEKELQDILSDIQRIPIIMCRPNIVIVFDELDKVEPGDTDPEKENMQTKATMFSIDAARERQTEILRILSNMKYFLSTAKAKFIFIAGREMLDFHLADVSERNNYIGSIFNVVISVPSFLTDHHTGRKSLLNESSIASLPEEFVCRRLIPHDYPVDSYNLENYRKYLENKIFCKDTQNNSQKEASQNEKIQKTIAVLQQFIIYLAHVSKGAPKKMMQLFESFVEIRTERDNKNENTLFIQYYHGSRHFLSFNYYKQYTIGIIAYLITPILYRLAESNIKEHSDKLLVSSLRFVDFLFKFHKNSFSWKHLDMSPEMLEVNRAPELKSVVVDLLNYLTQVHINRSNFSLSEYKFDGLISNEIYAMVKTDEVFSALFSFSLDETLPLIKHYKDLLEKKEKEYQKEDKNDKISTKYIDAVSSLQGVLGDLHYYNDELEEAEAYYKSTVQTLSKKEMPLEKLYEYVRNMLRLGLIYEKRKQYDFAYLTYGELCERIIQGRDNTKTKSRTLVFKNSSPETYNMMFKKMTYEGLKMLYLPFIAKLQMLEQSHIGGITRNHLEQLDEEFEFLTYDIDREEAKLLEAEFYSRVADVLYYKNSDLKCKNDKNRIEDTTDDHNGDTHILPENCSCTACYYYHKALSILLGKPDCDILEKKNNNKVIDLLRESVKQLKINENYKLKFCTILARILSDWGNVFFSCDIYTNENSNSKADNCYICDKEVCNTILQKGSSNNFIDKCIKFLESEGKNGEFSSLDKKQLETKKNIAFAMYSISSVAYRRANLYKRSSYQMYKMLCLFKDYNINNDAYTKKLSKQAIHYLWHANDDLNVLELNKRKKDFGKDTIKKKIPLQNLLVDTEITRIRVLVKELKLRSELISKIIEDPKKIKKYYDIRITSPYRINYSIVARIYRLRLKSKVNFETFKILLGKLGISENDFLKEEFKLKKDEYYDKMLTDLNCNKITQEIFGESFNTKEIFENLIADSIYCLMDIAQLIETMDETYLFPHSFMGSVHKHLSFWIRHYEAYEVYKKENPEKINHSHIERYLKQYLDVEWREQLSGYRENQRALSHYYKSLEMHKEGRAYHNMIDIMCYVKDDFNDRSDHFNIAEERHLIVNGEIEENIKGIKDIYEDSRLYNVDNYFEKHDSIIDERE